MSDQTRSAQPLSSAEYVELMRQKRQQNQVSENLNPNPQNQNPQFQSSDNQNEDLFPGISKPIPKRTIVSWVAPSRPFKKRDHQYYVTVIAIVFLVSLILFFAGQFLPIAVVVSVGFLAYVLSSVPPHSVKIEINTHGIEIEDMIYYWEEMGRFWVDEKFNRELLTIEVARFPGRIILMFEEDQKKRLKEILSEVLIEEKPAETFYEKAAKWIQEKIPLEVSS